MMFVCIFILMLALMMLFVAVYKNNKTHIVAMVFVIIAQVILIVGDTML